MHLNLYIYGPNLPIQQLPWEATVSYNFLSTQIGLELMTFLNSFFPGLLLLQEIFFLTELMELQDADDWI
jgi:hypothetical protein